MPESNPSAGSYNPPGSSSGQGAITDEARQMILMKLMQQQQGAPQQDLAQSRQGAPVDPSYPPNAVLFGPGAQPQQSTQPVAPEAFPGAGQPMPPSTTVPQGLPAAPQPGIVMPPNPDSRNPLLDLLLERMRQKQGAPVESSRPSDAALFGSSR